MPGMEIENNALEWGQEQDPSHAHDQSSKAF